MIIGCCGGAGGAVRLMTVGGRLTLTRLHPPEEPAPNIIMKKSKSSLLEEPEESISMSGSIMLDPIALPGAPLCRAIIRTSIDVSSVEPVVSFIKRNGRSMLNELSKPL